MPKPPRPKPLPRRYTPLKAFGAWGAWIFLAMGLLIGAETSLMSAENVAEGEKPVIRISRRGEHPATTGAATFFTGTVRVDQPFSTEAPARVGGAHVAFEPGARTAWHTHPLGQTLIVTFGQGRVQQWGGPVFAIGAGDVVWFPPNVKHWHGAAPEAAMGHIAIAESLDGKAVDWMEHVDDATYRQTPAYDPSILAVVPVAEKSAMNPKDQALVPVAIFAARGDMPRLKEALAAGLDAGLTVNEIKEALIQLYAYAGFPRCLNALGAFMEVLAVREKRGVTDEVGPEGRSLPADADKDALGAKNRSAITGLPATQPPAGYQVFAPAIDQFLKEHLFADIFERGVLTFRQREIVTISALSGMEGVESQLLAHLNGGLNVGVTEAELRDLVALLMEQIGKPKGEAVARLLDQAMQRRITPK